MLCYDGFVRRYRKGIYTLEYKNFMPKKGQMRNA